MATRKNQPKVQPRDSWLPGTRNSATRTPGEKSAIAMGGSTSSSAAAMASATKPAHVPATRHNANIHGLRASMAAIVAPPRRDSRQILPEVTGGQGPRYSRRRIRGACSAHGYALATLDHELRAAAAKPRCRDLSLAKYGFVHDPAVNGVT